MLPSFRLRARPLGAPSRRVRPDTAVPAYPALQHRAHPAPADRSTLGGDWRGDCFVVERRWTPSARHGTRGDRHARASGSTRRPREAVLFASGAAGAGAVRVLRSRDHRAERRRGDAGVPRRLRLVRRRRRVRDAAVPAHAPRRRAAAARDRRRRAGARRRARQLQRQVVRRAAARDALSVPPARVVGARAAARRRAASGAAVLECRAASGPRSR